MSNEEQWRSVIGYEGLFDVSSTGRIRSLDRQSVCSNRGCLMRYHGQQRKTTLNTRGYPSVSLRWNGRKATKLVHILVAQAFLGPRPKGMEVAHWDGDEANNRVENLRWATKLDNHADKVRHGTRLSGERHPMAKVTDKEVAAIRTAASAGALQKVLAQEYGVSQSTISALVTKRRRRE